MVSYPSQQDYDTLTASRLFLSAWYVAEHGSALPRGVDPLMDFCIRGWQAGRTPNPYFDCDFYLRENASVRQSGVNPLLHYLREGEHQGRRPIAFFDPAWYRAKHELPADENSLAHLLQHRFTGSTSPTPDFNPTPYLRLHPELLLSQKDPFLHWQSSPDAPSPTERDIIAFSGLFDPSYYLLSNPDVRESRQDPLSHFLHYGAQEFRNPNLYFDMRYYTRRLDTTRAVYGNPVAQYYIYGETQGEQPGPHFDPAWYARTYALEPCYSALRHYLENRRGQRVSPNPSFNVHAYMATYGASIGHNRDPFVHYLRTRA